MQSLVDCGDLNISQVVDLLVEDPELNLGMSPGLGPSLPPGELPAAASLPRPSSIEHLGDLGDDADAMFDKFEAPLPPLIALRELPTTC